MVAIFIYRPAMFVTSMFCLVEYIIVAISF